MQQPPNFDPNQYVAHPHPQMFGRNPYPRSNSQKPPEPSKPQERFRSEAPYPEIRVKEKNPFFAREIVSNMGGRDSEMTAVALYFYDHLISENLGKHKNIAKAFMKISMTEMKHLEIFGELALNLGADPRLWERQKQGMRYWSAAFVPYPEKNIESILTGALKAELSAIEKYKRQIKIIDNNNIKEILERIIEDEKIHAEYFKKTLLEVKQLG